MDFSLTDEQQATADLARQILTDRATHEKLRELEKSGEYARGLDTKIQEKDVYINQLENAVAESRQLLEGCQAQIAEMGATMEELDERTSKKKKKK